MPNPTVSPTVIIGKKVPAFSLPCTGNKSWSLTQAAGKPLVIYFYPRDATAGCTQEGLQFSELHAEFTKIGVGIVGVSPDTLTSHEKFKQKMQFPFELLADTERAVCQLFDVIKEKSMYGRKYLGVERSTFLLDARHTLKREWRKVKVPGHAAEVLAAAQTL